MQTLPGELALRKLEEYGEKPIVAWQLIEMPSLTPRSEYTSGFIGSGPWRNLLFFYGCASQMLVIS